MGETSLARTRRRHLVRLRNSLDFSLLEPGDLVLVANPTDPWPIQLAAFWSHVAIYVGGSEDRAFVDAVNLPIRRAGRRHERGLPWQRVRYTSLRMFRSYVDVLVLRPNLPAEARRAAADFALAQVGKPFSSGIWAGMRKPRGGRGGGDQGGDRNRGGVGDEGGGEAPGEFTCASLIWHAYRHQGLDLSSGPLRRLLLPWPSLLGHDRRLAHVGKGTRYKSLRPVRGQLLLLAARAWFRWALRSDNSWRGEPEPEETGGPVDRAEPAEPVGRAGRAVASASPPTPGGASHQADKGRR